MCNFQLLIIWTGGGGSCITFQRRQVTSPGTPSPINKWSYLVSNLWSNKIYKMNKSRETNLHATLPTPTEDKKITWPYWSSPGGDFTKFCTGMLLDFRISTISLPRKVWFCDPSLYQIAAKNTQFETNLVLFGQNAPNLRNWVHWVWNGNPPIGIPKNDEKAP